MPLIHCYAAMKNQTLIEVRIWSDEVATIRGPDHYLKSSKLVISNEKRKEHVTEPILKASSGCMQQLSSVL